jgi:arginine N-succinyltransferase
MFLIRPAVLDDLGILLKLARTVHFVNLPPDKDIIASKVIRSRKSFEGDFDDNERERTYMFCMEDTETGNVIGTSMIVCCISWPGHPHTYLRVRRRELFSDDLQSGQVHLTLEFETDETGPSELGGLILAPGYRGHPDKLGKTMSMVRLHYMGLHPGRFKERVLAEMMGRISPDNRNLLWDYLGRRFINLSYKEADLFCQRSKEFMTSLFPPGEIYASLLPPEARNLIAKVGDETRPARAMLEKQSFRYEGSIDPFDGGPYLEADRDSVPLIRATGRFSLNGTEAGYDRIGIVSCQGELGFRAIRSEYRVDGESVSIPHEVSEVIGAVNGTSIGITPLE